MNEITGEPLGWWYNYPGAYYWIGPFKTVKEAQDDARDRAGNPMDLNLLLAAPWHRMRTTTEEEYRDEGDPS